MVTYHTFATTPPACFSHHAFPPHTHTAFVVGSFFARFGLFTTPPHYYTHTHTHVDVLFYRSLHFSHSLRVPVRWFTPHTTRSLRFTLCHALWFVALRSQLIHFITPRYHAVRVTHTRLPHTHGSDSPPPTTHHYYYTPVRYFLPTTTLVILYG